MRFHEQVGPSSAFLLVSSLWLHVNLLRRALSEKGLNKEHPFTWMGPTGIGKRSCWLVFSPLQSQLLAGQFSWGEALRSYPLFRPVPTFSVGSLPRTQAGTGGRRGRLSTNQIVLPLPWCGGRFEAAYQRYLLCWLWQAEMCVETRWTPPIRFQIIAHVSKVVGESCDTLLANMIWCTSRFCDTPWQSAGKPP